MPNSTMSSYLFFWEGSLSRIGQVDGEVDTEVRDRSEAVSAGPTNCGESPWNNNQNVIVRYSTS